MTFSALPDVLERSTAVFIFALGIGLVAMHTVLVTLAAQQAAIERQRRVLIPGLVGAFLAVWLGLAITIGDRATVPLASEGLRPLISLLVGFGPMVFGIAVLFTSRTLHGVIAAMPTSWLIRAQTYRMAGVMFLFPFWYYGMVPAGFAIPAGVGDLLTGALAPVVALAVARRRRHAFAWAVAWNVFGLLDLIVAPTAAVLSQAGVLGLYPLSLVPLFIGPPLGILTHVYSFRNLAVHARQHREVHHEGVSLGLTAEGHLR